LNQPGHQNLTEQITRARQLIQEGLQRYSRLDPTDCKEVFLLRDDRFQGIRFTLGMFEAKWMVGDAEVAFFRDGTKIATRQLDSATIPAAA
jgi:hypothetical protein